jgi:cytochrome c peroxidase
MTTNTREKAAAVLAALAFAQSVVSAPLDEPIKPIPLTHNQDPEKVEIGRRLFHDKRLSGNGNVSCASCHDMQKGGADGLTRSPGTVGKLTGANSPTVFNSGLNFRQLWNGRLDSLEAQVEMIIEHPVVMGSKWEKVIALLAADPTYSDAFRKSYKDGVTKANVENAIASFERALITPNSRFDKYLRGDQNAITEAEKNGYAKFKQYGCVACHQGVNIGGNMFQTFGVMGDYFKDRGNVKDPDLGRFLVTKKETDKHVFKVPSLRNVALTAPYFHDASAKTLEEAVDVMFKYQLGRTAPKEDKESIIKFLHTLTGELEGKPL